MRVIYNLKRLMMELWLKPEDKSKMTVYSARSLGVKTPKHFH